MIIVYMCTSIHWLTTFYEKDKKTSLVQIYLININILIRCVLTLSSMFGEKQQNKDDFKKLEKIVVIWLINLILSISKI